MCIGLAVLEIFDSDDKNKPRNDGNPEKPFKPKDDKSNDKDKHPVRPPILPSYNPYTVDNYTIRAELNTYSGVLLFNSSLE